MQSHFTEEGTEAQRVHAAPLPRSLYWRTKKQGFKPRSGLILPYPAATLDKHTVEISRMNQFIEWHFFSVNLYKTPQIEGLFSHWWLGVCADRSHQNLIVTVVSMTKS